MNKSYVFVGGWGDDGDILEGLKIGKTFIIDCMGPSEFTVIEIRNNGIAKLKSGGIYVYAYSQGNNKWRVENNFFGEGSEEAMKEILEGLETTNKEER